MVGELVGVSHDEPRVVGVGAPSVGVHGVQPAVVEADPLVGSLLDHHEQPVGCGGAQRGDQLGAPGGADAGAEVELRVKHP